jgi:hypothetical protein
MCGEIDEDGAGIGHELVERFGVMARMLGVADPQSGGAPKGLESSEGRAAYMEALFSAGLTRSLADARAVDAGEAVDAVAAQAIAFARLAGFLAGQLPPEADLFRSVIEAVTAGYSEPSRLAHRWEHEQAHLHGHDHTH